jgi:hypothetical protein
MGFEKQKSSLMAEVPQAQISTHSDFLMRNFLPCAAGSYRRVKVFE